MVREKYFEKVPLRIVFFAEECPPDVPNPSR